VAEFTRIGFQGALNWYRIGAGKYAAELQILSGRTIDVPACFITGASEWVPYFVPGALERMETTACTQWRGTHFLEGAGHWAQQEQPEEVSRLILQFLRP
jgi:pimeloyl-ACP methyl ester carboxylesterase